MVRLLSAVAVWVACGSACFVGFPPRVEIDDGGAASPVDAGDAVDPDDAGPGAATGTPDSVVPAPAPDASERPDLAVAPPRLLGLEIRPPAPVVPFGGTLDLRVVGLFSDGLEGDVTARSTFSLADPDLAVVSTEPPTPGRVYPLAVGSSRLTASVAALTSEPVTLSVTGAANATPAARLQCPESGEPGMPLTFDASGSTDADGRITAWIFDFGDDADPFADAETGRVTHAFPAAGRYEVTVTVTDDAGGADAATCTALVGEPTPLGVAIDEPADGSTVERGDDLSVTCTVRVPSPAATSEIRLIVDGAFLEARPGPQATFRFRASDELVDGDRLRLQAEALDADGHMGRSPEISVRVAGDADAP